jgi:hypothetical protein
MRRRCQVMMPCTRKMIMMTFTMKLIIYRMLTGNWIMMAMATEMLKMSKVMMTT